MIPLLPFKPSFSFLLPVLITLISLTGCRKAVQFKEPEAALAHAKDQMLSYSIDDAKKTLAAHQNLFPKDHPLFAEFTYFYSISRLHSSPPNEGEILQAEEDLEYLLASMPDFTQMPAVLLTLGRMREMRDYANDEPRLDEAREAYQQLIDQYPQSSEAGEAAARYAITWMKETDDQKADFEKGAAFLETWLENNTDSVQATSIALFMAQIQDQYLQDSAKALFYYQLVDEKGFNNEGQAGAKIWRMAELAIQEGEIENAVNYLVRVVRDYSKSGRAYESQQLLKQLRSEHPDMDIEIPTLQQFNSEGGRP
jgi:TolA-binding protein